MKNRWLHLGKHGSQITLSMLSVTFSGCSAAAAHCVRRRQWSLHQVSDGARPGLDHLLCRRGKLQGGGEEESVILLLLISSCTDSKVVCVSSSPSPDGRLTWLSFWRTASSHHMSKSRLRGRTPPSPSSIPLTPSLTFHTGLASAKGRLRWAWLSCFFFIILISSCCCFFPCLTLCSIASRLTSAEEDVGGCGLIGDGRLIGSVCHEVGSHSIIIDLQGNGCSDGLRAEGPVYCPFPYRKDVPGCLETLASVNWVIFCFLFEKPKNGHLLCHAQLTFQGSARLISVQYLLLSLAN